MKCIDICDADFDFSSILSIFWESARHAEITVPVKGDYRSRYGFIRRSVHHLEKIKRAWSESKQKQTYLGEWHTHPEARPKPSGVDLHEWRNNLLKLHRLYLLS